ncbi:MAG: carboxypeptidase-like regulatory domain-containing protein, partial [Schleiferiaceae bacterium]
MRKLYLFLLLTVSWVAQAQVIRGTVVDDASNDPIPGAIVSIQGSPIQAPTDFDGNFELRGMVPGLYNVSVSFIGYEGKTQFEVQVTQAKAAVVNFRLREALQVLDEVVISTQQQFKQEAQSPVSVQSIGINEIQRNPGGNSKITEMFTRYLQFLFKAIGLPFLPTYNVYQFKVKHNFNRNNQLTILSLGAYDVSVLNTDQNETPEQRYILNYLPEYDQWNYSIGAKYTHFGPGG